MKRKSPAKTVAVSLVLAAMAKAGSVHMKNGDHLEGAPSSFAADHLLWNSTCIEEPLTLPLTSLVGIKSDAPSPLHPGGHELALSLTNGDIVLGQLHSVDEKTVVLDTSFAGRMAFNRLMVDSAEVRVMRKEIYRGPGGDPKWRFFGKAGAWLIEEGVLVCASQAGNSGAVRDAVLPEVCALSLDLDFSRSGNPSSFTIDLFTPDGEENLSGRFAQLTLYRYEGGLSVDISHSRGSESFNVQDQGDKELRLEMLLDSKKGVLVISIDGTVVSVMRDFDEALTRKTGGGIRFSSQGNRGGQGGEAAGPRVTRISVAEWNGVYDDAEVQPAAGDEIGIRNRWGGRFGRPEVPRKPAKKLPGVIYLANGDEMKGEIKGFEDSMVKIDSSFGPVSLPVSRLRDLPISLAAKERCIRRNGDVRVAFSDGSSMVFRLTGSEDGTLLGDSQNFGQAAFRIPMVKSVDFDIYEAEYEKLKAANNAE